jgi:hypothetical protein
LWPVEGRSTEKLNREGAKGAKTEDSPAAGRLSDPFDQAVKLKTIQPRRTPRLRFT